MAQATLFKPIALVVEDDKAQRELVVMLLEESKMGVIECDNAEDALKVIEKLGPSLSLLYTDVNLAGQIDGVELAYVAHEYPNIHVVVASGYGLKKSLPENALFMAKPWLALDLLREAERSQH
jgi:DNA-binding NtrC family response regulator